ncbi:15266_t:CDS:2 [Entrophospora sp. SA101]|nr:15266_t:CDS:2 [Entrophospora sp. SA101]
MAQQNFGVDPKLTESNKSDPSDSTEEDSVNSVYVKLVKVKLIKERELKGPICQEYACRRLR